MQVLSDRFSELHFRLKLTLFKQPLMSRCISIVSFGPPRRTDIPEYSKSCRESETFCRQVCL